MRVIQHFLMHAISSRLLWLANRLSSRKYVALDFSLVWPFVLLSSKFSYVRKYHFRDETAKFPF